MRSYKRISFIVICFALCVYLISGCGTIGLHIENQSKLSELSEQANEKKCVVIDLDDTIVLNSNWNSFKLVLDCSYGSVPLFEEAAKSIDRIREKYHVIFITARDDSLVAGTRRLLKKNGLDDVPIIFSVSFISDPAKQEKYKTLAIKKVQSKGLKIAAGVGDKGSDLGAYLASGINSIHIIFENRVDEDVTTVMNKQQGTNDKVVITKYYNQSCWPKIADSLLKEAE